MLSAVPQKFFLVSCLILLSLSVRILIGFGPFSGHNSPPIYGDFEAQRHWLEITVNLPLSQWYVNSTDNDLNYWGLDYPPLTAYHSYIMGKVAQKLLPEAVDLHTSRGIQVDSVKQFMRSSVLFVDLMVFFPALFACISVLSPSSPSLSSLLVTFSPTFLLLIDNGHFQYNNVAIGLGLFAFYFLIKSLTAKQTLNLSLCCFFFSLSLNYKQMMLLQAPFFFFSILFSCFKAATWCRRVINLLAVSFTTLTTFLLLWLPFILTNTHVNVLYRIFPVFRGIFEDKVANFWSSFAPLINYMDVDKNLLLKFSLLFSLVTIIPSIIYLLLNFRSKISHNSSDISVNLLLCLALSSMTTFIFGYQIHEKTLLIAAVPLILFLNFSKLFQNFWNFVAPFFEFIVCSSLFPLLLRDGLILQYFVVIIYLLLRIFYSKICILPAFFVFPSLFFFIILHYCLIFISPPVNLPFLWSYLLTSLSFLYLCIFIFIGYLYLLIPEKITKLVNFIIGFVGIYKKMTGFFKNSYLTKN
ncbi:hypothetical protein RCL1_001288 [Eukaryota sp. TZLM3-RCL]